MRRIVRKLLAAIEIARLSVAFGAVANVWLAILLARGDERLAELPQSVTIQRERQLLAEKRALMQQDRNLSRKRLRSESLRSSLSVWEAVDDND